MSKTIIRYVEEQIGRPVPIVTGTPDIRKIRKIEEEIFGEAMTLYPGDWKDIARDTHWKDHARHSFDYVAPGCVWCEDHRQDRERIKAEAEAKYAEPTRKAWTSWMCWAFGSGAWIFITGFILFVLSFCGG